MDFQDLEILIRAYLLIANLYAFLLYGLDKYFAIRSYRRVPERKLLILALAFGSVGAFFGMLLFRHKIKKRKFRYLLPLFLLLHIAILYLLFWKNAGNIIFL